MNRAPQAREKMITRLFFLFLFICVALFFTTVHPVTIISGDEWYNLSLSRQAYPQWRSFNPIKVVPEVAFPLFCNMASAVLMPLGFSFLESITFFTAVLIAALVVMFLYHLYALFREKMDFSHFISLSLTFFYFLCLFGLFRKLSDNNSPYLLWEQNLTCYYHYIMPALLNGALTLYLLRKGSALANFRNENPANVSLVIFAAYLCIFSNIFANIFLAILCGVVLLFSCIKNRGNLILSVRNYPLHALILVAWLASAIYEMNGGRAEMMATSGLDIHGAATSLFSLFKLVEATFSAVVLTGLVTGIVLFTKWAKHPSAQECRYVYVVALLCGAITLVALLLICAKAGAFYALRPAAVWGLFMYLIVAASIAFGYLVNVYKGLQYIVPVILLCLLNKTTDQDKSLRESHNGNLPYATAKDVSQFMIDQVISADKAGRKSMTLIVPKGDDIDNWPFPLTRGKEIAETLKSNGVIKNDIDITVQADRAVNEKFHLPPGF
ncbi:Inner membrane protein [Kosakonia sp. BK9b]